LADDLYFDVFPATLDGFYTLVQTEDDSYRLGWDDMFPMLKDADGNGLTDAFEVASEGFNLLLVDSDCEGFINYWEAFHGTDPERPDTDNDGLLDSEEILHINNPFRPA
jgi:hypothetical protein